MAPSLGFNRLVFKDQLDAAFASRNPAYYSRFALAVSGTTQNEQGGTTRLKRGELLADFSIDYGLPGNAAYDYRRPFDYFNIQFTASSANRSAVSSGRRAPVAQHPLAAHRPSQWYARRTDKPAADASSVIFQPSSSIRRTIRRRPCGVRRAFLSTFI